MIPERPPELRSAPPLDFRIVWIFLDFVCILITVHTYVKKNVGGPINLPDFFLRGKKNLCFFSDEFLLFSLIAR